MVDFGGSGGPIVLLHGLMGRASTWWRTAQWLREYGHVYGLDARAHGRNPLPGPYSTEVFVDDLAGVLGELGPATLIGHSMGGLHALGLAATHPELASAVVVEDMAVDQRGRTVDDWRAMFATWPAAFGSIAEVREFFGSAGDYFAECFEERADGYQLIADINELFDIAAEWGRREYWSYVDNVACPVLFVEAENSLMPSGQLTEMATRCALGSHILVPGAGHLVHEDQPEIYRGAVEAFLSGQGAGRG